jgi:NADPH:quinone reductase-like Zn-dependent oxidoreductase
MLATGCWQWPSSGYAEAVTVRVDQCYRLPPSMSFADAASLSLVYDTAWSALRERARLESGETVLMLGASGGFGHAAIQPARVPGCAGACRNSAAGACGIGAGGRGRRGDRSVRRRPSRELARADARGD